SNARRIRSGTGRYRCVPRLAATIVVVEHRIPITMGCNPVVADASASSQPTALTVPTTMDEMAPTVLAFFHHTAQTYAGTKALPSTVVENMTIAAIPGGLMAARRKPIMANVRTINRETHTIWRSDMSRLMK